MGRQGAYGSRLGRAFRMQHVPALITRVLQKSTMAVTELRCNQPNFGRTNPIPREDAYLVALQLRACPNHDLYFDGRLTRPENYREGVTSIYDLRRDPVADIRDPFHSLILFLPRTALDAWLRKPECGLSATSDTGSESASTIRQCGICFRPCFRRCRSRRKPTLYF